MDHAEAGRSWRRRTEATFFGSRAAKPGEGGEGGAGDGVSRNAAFTTFSAFPAPAAEKSRVIGSGADATDTDSTACSSA